MKETQPQMGEGRGISAKPEEGQQSAFRDNSPRASEMIEKGARTPEQSRQDAEKEEQEMAEKKKREWSTEISQEERERMKRVAEDTLDNNRIHLNRRGLGSASKKGNSLQGGL